MKSQLIAAFVWIACAGPALADPCPAVSTLIADAPNSFAQARGGLDIAGQGGSGDPNVDWKPWRTAGFIAETSEPYGSPLAALVRLEMSDLTAGAGWSVIFFIPQTRPVS